jgi:PEP phosphonomutase and related enzymes
MQSPGKRLRELISGPQTAMAPGCYDAMGARLIESLGFPAAYMSGFCVAASCGKPDIGILAMADVVERARSIAQSVSIPLIVDADTGYGGIPNVVETVRALEQAGAAAIQLEDQITPKRCAAIAGKELVPVHEMQQKLRAAAAARRDPDGMVIIGRTDALGVHGLDEALRRLAAWEDAGADVTMVLDISSEEEMRAIAAAARKPTVMLPMSVMLKKLSHLVTPEEAGKRGFSMVIHPSILLLAGVAAQRNVLRELAASGSVQGSLGAFAGFDEINALAGLPEFNEWSARFPTDAA